MTRCHGLVVLAACCSALVPDTAAYAQTQDNLFDTSVVHEVRIQLNSRDLRQLRARFRDDTYYPADFQWGHIRVRNVAIRSRGVASRNPDKPGLRIDFNRYTSGQTFLGLHSLVLKNLWENGSMVAESAAMAFFARMGQPASRESYARVFINGEYHGVYAITEQVDEDFLSRTLGEHAGYLFSFQQPTDQFRAEDLGDGLAPYQALFQPHTHEREAATTLYSPLRELFREVNHPVDAVWRDRVEQYLDLAQFVTHVAIENFLAENDGILGWSGMTNFYLYRYAGSTRHRLIVWDKDNTFQGTFYPIMHRADENVIFRTAITYPDLRTLYLQTLETCARAASDDQWLEHEIGRQATLIDAAVREDTRKQFSNDVFDEMVSVLVSFARERSAFVLQEIARLR